ncbi:MULTISPECIES: hypothetical protein [unclassified Pannonibacter]|uniref:hypothetical protein n=1 Tax=unclassified Pannonibacter TaxID=2627228 RepID=UPI00164753CD|nr:MULTISPECIES: hypothetical protein [unclassified Pannonibacter]
MTGPRITAASPASNTTTRKDIMRLAAWIAFIAAYALVVAVLASPRGTMAGSNGKAQISLGSKTEHVSTAPALRARTQGNLPGQLVLAGFANGRLH